MRSHQHLAIFFTDACRCRVDILDIEIEQPERYGRVFGISGHHRADLARTVIEDPIDSHRPHVHRALHFPAKEIGVKRPGGLLVVSREFIPADSPWCPGGRTRRRIIKRSSEEKESGALRIFRRCEAAYGWNVLRCAM